MTPAERPSGARAPELRSDDARADVLIVGAGGIGAPAAMALAAAGVRTMAVVDDDLVEATNLHRQILFSDDDVGRAKTRAFAAAVSARSPSADVRPIDGRALPDTAVSLARRARVVIDATDNFASRFLLADACALAGVPVVHAAAVRWRATVLAVPARGRPCYRCLFEDLPEGPAPDCATAGVAGPVCGVAGAIAADRALDLLAGDERSCGAVVTYDGLRDRLRSVPVRARSACPLCGAARAISTIDASRYEASTCA